MALTKKDVKALQTYLGSGEAVLTDVLTEVPGVADEFHLKMGSSARFDPVSGEVKVTLTFVYGDEADGRRAEFERFAHIYKLKPEDFGATFTNRGVDYEITGLRTSGRTKRPVIAKRLTGRGKGKEYTFEADGIVSVLRKPHTIRWKHEDEIERGAIGPVVGLDEDGEIIHHYGWRTRNEALAIAARAGIASGRKVELVEG